MSWRCWTSCATTMCMSTTSRSDARRRREQGQGDNVNVNVNGQLLVSIVSSVYSEVIVRKLLWIPHGSFPSIQANHFCTSNTPTNIIKLKMIAFLKGKLFPLWGLIFPYEASFSLDLCPKRVQDRSGEQILKSVYWPYLVSKSCWRNSDLRGETSCMLVAIIAWACGTWIPKNGAMCMLRKITSHTVIRAYLGVMERKILLACSRLDVQMGLL